MSSKKQGSESVPEHDEVDVEAGDNTAAKNEAVGLLMNNPEALAAMQSKLAGMVGTLSGYYDTLPTVVKRRVKALKKMQVEFLNIEAKFHEEVHQLECKYAQMYEPLYLKRSEIVNGKVEPTDEECDFPSDDEDDDEEGEKTELEKKEESNNADDADKDENPVGVPEFWLTIFKNVEVIAENIQTYDEPILIHLVDIKVKLQEEPMGFTLEFHFSPNEYFSNEMLTKRYDLRSKPDETDPFSFEGAEIYKCKGCEISWKKGKNVTVKTVVKKQKHKSKGSVRTVSKTVRNDSFFNFFAPPEVPENEDDMDEETQALLSADFEIGEVIRQRLVQRAVLYFTGEALVDEEYDDEEDEDEEDDLSDEEDDKDFEVEKVVKPKGKTAKHQAAQKKGDSQQDCKQQ